MCQTKKTKTILFLINSLTSGGAERVATTILNKLSDRYNIHLCTVEKDKFYKLNKNIDYKTLSDYTLKTKKVIKVLSLPVLLANYITTARTVNPDILVSFMEMPNFFNIITSKIIKKPVIISVRVNPKIQYTESIKSKIYNYLIKKLYPHADEIIVVSKEIKEILSKDYGIPEDRIAVIYNAHNINQYIKRSYEPIENDYMKLFRDSFVFITIGRLTEQKAHWFLIRSFKEVVSEHKNAKLIILGDGEIREELINLIKKLKLENNVFLLRNQTNPFKFLKQNNCFVLTSLWEGLPNTIIEALSVNLPVISTDCKTGPRELLEPGLKTNEEIGYPYFAEYGILTKPFKRESMFKTLGEVPLNEEENILADLMIKIIEEKTLREKYSTGIKRAKDFDVEKIIFEWENLINNLNNKNVRHKRL